MKRKSTINDCFNSFYREFVELNSENKDAFDSRYRMCPKASCRKLIVNGKGDKELVLPEGYIVYRNKNPRYEEVRESYIFNKKGLIVCGIYYNDNSLYSLDRPYPKNNIVPYEEYILERASIITERYFGEDKEDYLKLAILKMIDGNYNYFNKYDNTRFKLMLLSPSGIPRIMLSTLERNGIKANYSSIGVVTEIYTNYIKDKSNSIDKVDAVDNRQAYVKIKS